ncbi:TonB-dependent receptor plug domain-containing protein [Alteromonas hispanica]|uniref:TonB-dependent receptor plug domain-containing protein n=1 Tax=Alteromonas hispanica TaxID=315421 RepID=A0A6L9MYJ5_9ALTE|nr:TonB-dependent receptor plug domain-containing protein [Alteromonas hispanica]NDW23217.1 TonB-dependent receptor plug domain-containing protein [Alteromonas hispanica]
MSYNAALYGLLLSLAINTTVNAKEQPQKQHQHCISKDALSRKDKQSIAQCIDETKNSAENKKIEKIEVIGQYVGLQVPEVVGRFVLDRNLINAAPRNGGDFTELLELLPGIELGGERYDANEQGEISAQRVSIMGAQPWQTGFFINGVNFNSRQDPETYREGEVLINDVEGSTQAFNINQQILDSITVYTNNIPARYGSFSGGVVDVETREARATTPTFSLSYRGTQSDWNNYHVFLEEDVTQGNATAPTEPSFRKQSLNMNAEIPLSDHHGLLVSGNYINSEITRLSLNQPVLTERENMNLLVSLTQRNLWLDKLQLTLNYSPYESRDLITNAKNSDFENQGGGINSTFQLQHAFELFTLDTRMSYTLSDNSRRANPHFYQWAKAKGKAWGVGDPTEEVSISRQGGYGDLDKQQENLLFDTTLRFNTFSGLGVEHNIEWGIQLQHENLTRRRFYDSYIYNSPVTGIANLDCSGNLFDCVELGTSISIAELETQLGAPLDFANPEHILAYSNIVTTSPQYFSIRAVYPEEYLDVGVGVASMHFTDSIELGNLNINVGVRVDHDNFLKNTNIGPRVSGGYQLFGSGDKLITFGVNRYYDANLLTYKVREQQTPFIFQRRAVSPNGVVQGWQNLAAASDSRFIFNDLATPFNDEFTMGWKQSTWLGNFSLEYTKRWQRDQLIRDGAPVYNAQDGFFYQGQTNDGKGQNSRVSFSWAALFDVHSLSLNTSYILSESFSSNTEQDIEDALLNDLIFIRETNANGDALFTETTRDNLTIIQSEFSRPLSINFVWAANWSEQITTSVTGTFRTTYEDYVLTEDVAPTSQLGRFASQISVEESFNIPVYQRVEFPNRVLFNASINYTPQVVDDHKLQFRVDMQNIFDQRTYAVAPGISGIELGRSIWFEVGYQWQ